MDIEGLSEKTIGQLMDGLGIKEVYDLYDLSYDDLIDLERFGPKKTNNLLDAIEASKDVDLNRFIYAIGIPNVGERTARDLASKFKNFASLRKAEASELTQIPDIGEITAENIVEFFADANINEAIDLLLSKGIKINEDINEDSTNILEGLTYVITGTIDGYKRDDVKELIEKNGGKVTGSVSKKTDALICGENAGSKLDKAKSLDIKIIDGNELKEFLNELEGK